MITIIPVKFSLTYSSPFQHNGSLTKRPFGSWQLHVFQAISEGTEKKLDLNLSVCYDDIGFLCNITNCLNYNDYSVTKGKGMAVLFSLIY